MKNEGTAQMIVIAVRTAKEKYFRTRVVYFEIFIRFQLIARGSGALQIVHDPAWGKTGAVTAQVVGT